MHIRELQSDDDIWMMRDLAIAHHTELGGSRSFESSAVVQSALECRDQPMRYHNCWLVFNGEDKAVGYLAASSFRQYHTHKRIAMQNMWYVLPDYRGTRAGILLVRAYEDWADWLGCETAFMCVEHNELSDLTHKTARLIDRLGFKNCGSMHAKVLTTTEVEEE